MYVIEGYARGEQHWYDFKHNKWVNSLLDAEFFDMEDQAQWVINEFQYNKNDTATEWYRGEQHILAHFIYITPVFYSDDDIAKKMLLI